MCGGALRIEEVTPEVTLRPLAVFQAILRLSLLLPAVSGILHAGFDLLEKRRLATLRNNDRHHTQPFRFPFLAKRAKVSARRILPIRSFGVNKRFTGMKPMITLQQADKICACTKA